MNCPACGEKVANDAWICEACDHIIDLSFLEAEDEDQPRIPSQVTQVDSSQIVSNDDAVILGDLGEGDETGSFIGTLTTGEGKVSTVLFYMAEEHRRLVSPEVVPRVLSRPSEKGRLTPYERFVYSCIDGKRSVREIHRASTMEPHEVASAILTLADKGIIEVEQRPKEEELPGLPPDPPLSFAEVTDPDVEESTDDDDTAVLPDEVLRKRTARAVKLPELEPALEPKPTMELQAEFELDNEPLTVEPKPLEPSPAPPPVLDPGFLMPAEESKQPEKVSVQPQESASWRASRQEEEEDPAERRRRILASALSRGPIQERDRSRREQPPVESGTPAPMATAAPTPAPRAAAAPPKKVRKKDVSSVRQAQKLYEQAQEDIESDNLVSAYQNIKLALMFDPSNEHFHESLEQLSDSAPDTSEPEEASPKGVAAARELFARANDAESEGEIDEAIGLLEKAIRANRQAVYFNRLGVILAMKKKNYEEGKKLLETAVRMAPHNKNYQRNLEKVEAAAAGLDVDDKKDVKSRLQGLLRKKD